MKIIKLKWSNTMVNKYNYEFADAITPIGKYGIEYMTYDGYEQGYVVFLEASTIGVKDILEEAKLLAENHFEETILKCLE